MSSDDTTRSGKLPLTHVSLAQLTTNLTGSTQTGSTQTGSTQTDLARRGRAPRDWASRSQAGRDYPSATRFEPTVVEAARRYHLLVATMALLVATAAMGYTLVQPELYRASGSLTVPKPLALQAMGNDQYLDSQVLLLQSQDVAERAVQIANSALGSKKLTTRDLFGEFAKVEIAPPEMANPGSYGANTIQLMFTWPDPEIAQVGLNALLQGFDDARYATIKTESDASLAGIQKAISDVRSKDQLGDLTARRTLVLTNQQVDLAHHSIIRWAARPQTAINGNSKRAAAIGLLTGTILGVALAYALAVRRPEFADTQQPAELYGVPLLGEIPRTKATWRPRTARSLQELPLVTDPHSPAAESFRFAATSIERLRAEHGPRLSLAIVSPAGGRSQSLTVANLALALAEAHLRVLAVDANVGGRLSVLLLPGVGTAAKSSEQPLTGQPPLVARVRALSEHAESSPLNSIVYVLPSVPERTTTLAHYKALGALIAQARSCYDVVLVDCPGLLEVAGAVELLRASDTAIVVVSAGDLVPDHLATRNRLRLVGCSLAGYVLTVEDSDPRNIINLRNNDTLTSSSESRARAPR
jgi:Mrp family chromosome partitioning ATPase